MLFKTKKEYKQPDLQAKSEKGDLLQQLAAVIKKRGVQKIAKECDLSVTALYTVISKGGNPRLSTLNKLIEALNYRIVLRRNRQQKPKKG